VATYVNSKIIATGSGEVKEIVSDRERADITVGAMLVIALPHPANNGNLTGCPVS
jgi:hypothetical protein